MSGNRLAPARLCSKTVVSTSRTGRVISEYEEQLSMYTERAGLVLIQTAEQAGLNYSQIRKAGNFITSSCKVAYHRAGAHTFSGADLMNVQIPLVISSTHCVPTIHR